MYKEFPDSKTDHGGNLWESKYVISTDKMQLDKMIQNYKGITISSPVGFSLKGSLYSLKTNSVFEISSGNGGDTMKLYVKCPDDPLLGPGGNHIVLPKTIQKYYDDGDPLVNPLLHPNRYGVV